MKLHIQYIWHDKLSVAEYVGFFLKKKQKNSEKHDIAKKADSFAGLLQSGHILNTCNIAT